VTVPPDAAALPARDARFDTVELREIDLNITNRCNLTCEHCAFSSAPNDKTELPVDVIAEIVDDARALGCREIHLTGGEPTLHSVFEEVLATALRSGMFVRLISNGTMSTARLIRYRAMGLGHLLISVDGLSSVHDRIRGRTGAYETTMARVGEAVAAGYQVRLNAVAMRDNLEELLTLFSVAETARVAVFSIFLYSPTGRNAARQLDRVVGPREWRAFKDRLRERCRESPTRVFVERGFLFSDEDDGLWEPPPGRGGGCYSLGSLLDYALITANGNVFPCALLTDKGPPLGNIYQRRLVDIVGQPDEGITHYRSLRKPANECVGCADWMRCHGGCRAFVWATHQRWDLPDPECPRHGSGPPACIPVCRLLKEDLQGPSSSGFSEQLS
jgi:radical SAM protein with 4Fe4S-binding SPASM domain